MEIFNLRFENSESYKIISIINGDCLPCIADFNPWKKFIESMADNNRVDFLFYLVTADSTRIKILLDSIQFNIPVIFDPNNSMRKQNNLPNSLEHSVVFLDNNNKVILYGNPLRSKEMYNKYFDQLTSLNK